MSQLEGRPPNTGILQSSNYESKVKPAVTDCRICTKQFNRVDKVPYVLECGHTFCMSCLKNDEKETEAQKLAGAQSSLPAPRRVCPIDKKPIEKSILSLPPNRSIIDMLDELKEEPFVEPSASDPTVACFEDSNHEARWWCDGCQQPYCEECFNDAHKIKKIADHKHIPLYLRPRPPPKCPLHPEKDAIFVCQETQCTTGHQLFCTTCQKAKKHHRGHLFEELETSEYKNTTIMSNLLEQFKEVERFVNDKFEEAKRSVNSFEKESEQADAVRKRIEEHYREKAKQDIAKFETWREEQCEKKSQQLESFSQIKKEHYEHTYRIQRKVGRFERLYDLEDIVECSEKLIKKSRQGKHYPNLNDYTSANRMKLEPLLLEVDSAI